MITALAWDSAFFRKKIGELKISSEPFSQIEASLRRAKSEDYQYIICKTEFGNARLIRFLESTGFYLADIGITWSIKTGKLFRTANARREKTEKSVAVATGRDIPTLRKMAKSLFLESRFYHDPFFSKKEADALYMTWIENSIRGLAADIVFFVPDKGFVTCRKDNRTGKIVLIGVRKGSRGKGTGTALVKEAIRWFAAQGLDSVCVRTQLRNFKAMNFYLKLGFTIDSHDMVFAKIL